MVKRSVAAWMIAATMAAAGAAAAADSAVVLAYPRIGDGRSSAVNVRVAQLDAHVAELKSGGYTVVPLPEVVESLRTGRPLPDRAVAITVDGAWGSVYRTLWPRLRAAGLPFTVFVTTDQTDRADGDDAMTWDQLRELAASPLVTIGSQGAAYAHMASLPREEVVADLAHARDRFVAEMGRAPDMLAWPWGEAGTEAMDTARRAGFAAAFGQHSGAAWPGGNRWFLPRFALNEAYAEPDRFRLATRTLPLPVLDVTPSDPKLTTNPPAFGFTLADESLAPGLTCYTSAEGASSLQHLGPRVEIRPSRPFPSGRVRLNCTRPSLDGRWRWFGWQFVVPN